MGYEFIKNLKYIINCLLNLIYSSGFKCIGCGNYVEENDLLCSHCKKMIKTCNKSFDLKMKDNNIKCYSAFYYSSLGKELVRRLKYKRDFMAGEVISKYMLDTINKYKVDFDLITFVPCSKATLKKRGYNQSQFLAKNIAECTDIKLIQLLKKTKDTEDQIGLNGEERWNNLKDCFEITNINYIKDKKILLVDDVITTGATAYYCSKLLEDAGAECVYLCTGAKSSL